MVLNTSQSISMFEGYISLMRNMYIISSIGLASMAFSNRFSYYKKFVKLLSLIIFLYSIFYGFKSNRDFKLYLDFINEKDNLSKLDIMNLNQWNEWIIFGYVYMVILIILFLIIFFIKFL